MPDKNHRKVALVFMTKAEENIKVLNAIATYNRFHDRWSAFVDDDATTWGDPDWLLKAQHWDGAMCKHFAPDFFRRCNELKIPCVDLSDHPDCFPGIPKVRPDNLAMGQLAAEFFLERGYKNLAFCGFASEHWSLERGRGFCEAAESLGRRCQKLETTYPDFYHGPIYNPCGPGWDDHEKSNIIAWLESLPKPVGIFTCNDLRGLQVIEACRALGLHVPGEVAIMGSNNESFRCEFSQPQLSSIGLNTDFYGQTAAQILSELMKGIAPKSMEVFIDPLDPITRQSTDFSHMEDRTMVKALDIIWREACRGVTVDEVAVSIHVSRSLLERKFRRFLGRSPQAEIRNVQLKQVKQLLVDTDYTLDRVAELAGYQHTEYMHVVFKKATSLTPNQYRQRFRHA